jgi:hypothetical protein
MAHTSLLQPSLVGHLCVDAPFSHARSLRGSRPSLVRHCCKAGEADDGAEEQDHPKQERRVRAAPVTEGS